MQDLREEFDRSAQTAVGHSQLMDSFDVAGDAGCRVKVQPLQARSERVARRESYWLIRRQSDFRWLRLLLGGLGGGRSGFHDSSVPGTGRGRRVGRAEIHTAAVMGTQVLRDL